MGLNVQLERGGPEKLANEGPLRTRLTRKPFCGFKSNRTGRAVAALTGQSVRKATVPQPLESATFFLGCFRTASWKFNLFATSMTRRSSLRHSEGSTVRPASDAGSSDSSDGEPTTFVSDDCKEFSLSTGLLVTDLQAQVDGCFSSRLLMADNTRTWSEAGDQQSDSAHFLIVDARLLSTITMSSPQTWLLTGSGVGDSSAQCDSQNGASVTAARTDS